MSNSGWQAYIITYPGVTGIYGLNNHGVGVCLNAMGAFMNHSPNGLGTIFVVRGILAQTTLDEAIRFVREVPHASGENYTIGGPEKVGGL